MENILMAVRNYRGQKEINYLLTLEDFKNLFCKESCTQTLFSSHDLDKDWKHFVDTLESEGSAEWALWNNDTIFVMKCNSLDTLAAFLTGSFNDDVEELILENMGDSVVETIERYCDLYWYLDLEDSNEEIIKFASQNFPQLVNSDEHYSTPEEYAKRIYPTLNPKQKMEVDKWLKKKQII